MEVQPSSLTTDALTPGTFDDSSSSSSDEGEDEDVSPQAAAAWVKALTRTSGAAAGVRVECLVSQGAFLHAQLWVPVGGLPTPAALAAAAERTLLDAGLHPADVVAARVYAAGGALAASTALALAGQAVPVIAASAVAVAGDGPRPELGAADAMLDLWAAGSAFGGGRPKP